MQSMCERGQWCHTPARLAQQPGHHAIPVAPIHVRQLNDIVGQTRLIGPTLSHLALRGSVPSKPAAGLLPASQPRAAAPSPRRSPQSCLANWVMSATSRSASSRPPGSMPICRAILPRHPADPTRALPWACTNGAAMIVPVIPPRIGQIRRGEARDEDLCALGSSPRAQTYPRAAPFRLRVSHVSLAERANACLSRSS